MSNSGSPQNLSWSSVKRVDSIACRSASMALISTKSPVVRTNWSVVPGILKYGSRFFCPFMVRRICHWGFLLNWTLNSTNYLVIYKPVKCVSQSSQAHVISIFTPCSVKSSFVLGNDVHGLIVNYDRKFSSECDISLRLEPTFWPAHRQISWDYMKKFYLHDLSEWEWINVHFTRWRFGLSKW